MGALQLVGCGRARCTGHSGRRADKNALTGATHAAFPEREEHPPDISAKQPNENFASTSRPAQVNIEVTPQGNTTPPQVLWTNPAKGASEMAVSAAPVFTDTLEPVYAPVILIDVSEPLDTATVHAGTVTLTRGGAAVVASVTFDGGVNQIVLYSRAVLGAGEYRVTVASEKMGIP